MDAVELLKTRRSCRSYTGAQVDEKTLGEILACGLNAPSAMDRQDTKIIVVQDKQTVSKLSRLNAEVMGSSSDPFYGAPTVCLIVVSNDNKNGVKDGALVIGAMQDAAFALGVGSCWINRCTEMLELPEGRAFLDGLKLSDYSGVGCCILGQPAASLPEKKIKAGRVVRL